MAPLFVQLTATATVTVSLLVLYQLVLLPFATLIFLAAISLAVALLSKRFSGSDVSNHSFSLAILSGSLIALGILELFIFLLAVV